MDLHPEEIEARKQAFQQLWLTRFMVEVSRMPPRHQQRIHELLKLSFNAGSNYERRQHEQVSLGGCI